jgi:hypothetical protein
MDTYSTPNNQTPPELNEKTSHFSTPTAPLSYTSATWHLDMSAERLAYGMHRTACLMVMVDTETALLIHAAYYVGPDSLANFIREAIEANHNQMPSRLLVDLCLVHNTHHLAAAERLIARISRAMQTLTRDDSTTDILHRDLTDLNTLLRGYLANASHLAMSSAVPAVAVTDNQRSHSDLQLPTDNGNAAGGASPC